MIESRVRSAITSMEGKLSRVKIFKGVNQREDYITELDYMLYRLIERYAPSHIARSEVFVSDYEVDELRRRITHAHEYVIDQGESYFTYPDYMYCLAEGLITPEDARGRFWLKGAGPVVEANADLFPMSNPSSDSKLYLFTIGVGYDAAIHFGFEDNFALEIGFHHPDFVRLLLKYNSGELPLWGMTDEEYEVVSHCLEELTQSAYSATKRLL